MRLVMPMGASSASRHRYARSRWHIEQHRAVLPGSRGGPGVTASRDKVKVSRIGPAPKPKILIPNESLHALPPHHARMNRTWRLTSSIGPMQTTTLGRGGPVVSRAGLGLMGMSGIYGE